MTQIRDSHRQWQEEVTPIRDSHRQWQEQVTQIRESNRKWRKEGQKSEAAIVNGKSK